MYLKTLRQQAIENEASGTYPSTLAAWWKITEESGAKTLVDAVNGANITWTGAPVSTMTNGQISLSGALATKDFSIPLPEIGTNDFLFVIGGNASSPFAQMKMGDATNDYFDIINTGGNSTVRGVDGTTTITGAGFPSSGSQSYALKRSASPDETGIYVDGTVDASAVNDAAGALSAFTQIITWHNVLKVNGMALFIFPDGLPSDYAEAASWMGNQWLANNKVIWPRW